MAEQFIPANRALEICGSSSAICTRAYAGLIDTRARLILMNGQELRRSDVPCEFWWAKGYAALEQDWSAGDFSTWIDEKRHYQAFGVKFGLSGLLEMVEYARRPIIARSVSVAGDPDWIAAKEARRIVRDSNVCSPTKAGDFILEQGRLGFVAGRAIELDGAGTSPIGKTSLRNREWDVPAWYWQDYTGPQLVVDWDMGKFSGQGSGENGAMHLTLSGVHFHRASIEAITGVAAVSEASAGKLGRKATYDWEEAANAIWGEIYRGDFEPKSQAEVERFMLEFFRKGEVEPSESTVRPHAKRIWVQFSKEAEN